MLASPSGGVNSGWCRFVWWGRGIGSDYDGSTVFVLGSSASTSTAIMADSETAVEATTTEVAVTTETNTMEDATIELLRYYRNASASINILLRQISIYFSSGIRNVIESGDGSDISSSALPQQKSFFSRFLEALAWSSLCMWSMSYLCLSLFGLKEINIL